MTQAKQEDQRKPLWYDQPSFKVFKQEYDAKGARPLLFIGSGLSISAGLPNWPDLLRRLRQEAANLVKVSDDFDAAFDEKLRKKKYDEAGSLLKEAFLAGHAHQSEWRRLLHEHLVSPPDGLKIPDALRTLCALRWERIITTNYDQLIELAFRECHSQALRVYHPWQTRFDKAPRDNQRFVFKIHGDIGDDDSTIVLTTEEYEDLYKRKKLFKDVLKNILGNATVILFLGFSYDDRYLKELFNSLYFQAQAPFRPFALFPQPPPSLLKDEEKKINSLKKDTGIRPIFYRNPNDAHEEFVEFLEYLNEPKAFDQKYTARGLKKKATVILLHSGGTIGAIRSEHDRGDELDLHKISSRFHPRLQTISDMLQQRFRQFYNTASGFQFELKWEIVPQDQQILSENATIDHWNNLVNKVEEIVYKYLEGPNLITGPDNQIAENEPNSRRGGPTLRAIYERERKEFKSVHRKGDLTETEFLEDLEGRYIAGIVVLHGTDTLASAASALAVGLNDLPFPIVVTGANRPPDEGSLLEKVAILSSSDAWKNLVTSLYFLQCFGHRFTETFVCFGDTIHHGMNLRKTSIESAPLKRIGAPHQDIEPFIFRNASINKQYLFRLIDGVFCNNCYPIGKLPYTELIKPAYDYLRHVRQNPFRGGAAKTLTTFSFKPTVTYVAVSPSFPHLDVERMLAEEPSVRAVLVEGYKSGTYPTVESNRFTQFLSELYQHGIPVILVAHYGIKPTQERYETFRVDGTSIPVLRLYGMIPETALPLLCRVVSSIDKEEWEGPPKVRRSRVGNRVKLIARELKKLFKTTNNIISLEFGDITDPKAIGARIVENTVTGSDSESNNHALGHTIAQGLSIDPDTVPMLPDVRDDPDDCMVTIPRSDFLWTFSEIIKPVEKVGSAPDGFAIMADIGFEWGFKEFHQLCLKRVPRQDTTPFLDCTVRERKELRSHANKMLDLATAALEKRGIAYFEECETEIPVDEVIGEYPINNQRFSIKVVLKRRNQTIRGDEKYNVQSYSPLESEFFRQLNDGPARHREADPPIRGASNDDHLTMLADRYEELMESSWQCQTLGFDWYILGVFKGFTCAMAWYFLFDDWARWHDRNRSTGYDKAMRQSVKCDILQGGEAYFAFEMTYYGWYEHD